MIHECESIRVCVVKKQKILELMITRSMNASTYDFVIIKRFTK